MLHELQHDFMCYQQLTHDDAVSMQHERNIPARILNETEHDVWEQIELEFGPLDKLSDHELIQRLATEMHIATLRGERAVRVPAEVAERVLGAVLAKCRRGASANDKPALIEANRLMRKLSAHVRAQKPRPKHRPHKNWFLRRAAKIACYELKQRQRELMSLEGLSSGDALHQAAEEIAPGYFVQSATLISWWANPGRRRRK